MVNNANLHLMVFYKRYNNVWHKSVLRTENNDNLASKRGTLKQPKEFETLQGGKEVQKGAKSPIHLCRGSKSVFISICMPPNSLEYPNFSASLAIWTSQGVKYWYRTFTTKRGRTAATRIPSKHSQNEPVFAIWKMALHCSRLSVFNSIK